MAILSSSAPVDYENLTGLGVGALIGISLVGLAVWIVFLVAYIKIISKAGYSGWWVLIMFVPIVNVIMLLVFAFKEWPIQRELAELRGWANQIQRGGSGSQHGGSAGGASSQPGAGQSNPYGQQSNPFGGSQNPYGQQNPYGGSQQNPYGQ